MKTKMKIKLIVFTCLILSLLLPNWKYLFSKQDKIDPDTIVEEYDNNAISGIFNNQIVKIPADLIDNKNKVLGEIETKPKSNKRIEVDLTNQTTKAYEGDKLIYNFLISSGKWDRTPTGNFKIWTKVRSQKMSGGSKSLGTYYYLPNVPYVMFFYNDKVAKKTGYSFHGTYWHNNFGVPMSHGCINMITKEAGLLYNWAEVGTEVIISGKYKTILPKI